MSAVLSEGALLTMLQGGDCAEPVVQVLAVKKMSSEQKPKRRLLLSDGKYSFSFVLLGPKIYDKACPNGLPKYSIIKILRYVVAVAEGINNKILLMVDIELVKNGDEIGEQIGSPIPHYQEAQVAAAALANNNSKRKLDEESLSASVPSPKSSKTNINSTVPSSIIKIRENSKEPHHQKGKISGRLTQPIDSLTPYQNRWTAKVRVNNKSDIRTWSNSKGSGQLFSMDLADETGEIRCTAFKEDVDKFYDMIQVDKVYYISKCQIKPANKQFTPIKNDFEMSVTSETIIEECFDDDDDLANIQLEFNFQSIEKIAQIEPEQLIDVIGVVTTVGDSQTVTSKSFGRELKKREIQILDDSKCSINLTLWGAQAENFVAEGNSVVAIKGGRVTKYSGGKNLSVLQSSLIKMNPEIKECFKLKEWYHTEGKNLTDATDISATAVGSSLNSPWKALKEVTIEDLASIDKEKGYYYQAKGTILMLRRENCFYKACPTAECNKKVVDHENGNYKCEKCQKVFPNFKYRFFFNMNVADFSGNQWLSAFNEEAEKVVGISAQEAGDLQENDKEKFKEILENSHFKEFILKCRVKMENLKGEQKRKTVAVKISPLFDYGEYIEYLINDIDQLLKNLKMNK